MEWNNLDCGTVYPKYGSEHNFRDRHLVIFRLDWRRSCPDGGWRVGFGTCHDGQRTGLAKCDRHDIRPGGSHAGPRSRAAFGYYSFTDVEVGQSYTVSVSSKRFTFATRLINLNDAVDGLDFEAQ